MHKHVYYTTNFFFFLAYDYLEILSRFRKQLTALCLEPITQLYFDSNTHSIGTFHSIHTQELNASINCTHKMESKKPNKN